MNEARFPYKIRDGVAIVFSDAHYWPQQQASTAHRALVRLCGRLNPTLIVANGDILDGARISKHARIGWQKCPKLSDELATCKARLREIEHAAPNADKVWPLGNHDARFETSL